MKIGLDFDDVIADFFIALLNYYNKKYDRNDKPKDFKEFKWWPVWGISKEEAIKRVDEFHESHEVKNIMPIKDAVKSINELSNNNEFFIITSRPSRFKSKVESWIAHHINRKIEVIHSGDFHKDGRASKAEICLELKIPLLLEDVGENALDCAKQGIKVILFDKSWNQGFSHKNITRVKDWNEAMKNIRSLE